MKWSEKDWLSIFFALIFVLPSFIGIFLILYYQCFWAVVVGILLQPIPIIPIMGVWLPIPAFLIASFLELCRWAYGRFK